MSNSLPVVKARSYSKAQRVASGTALGAQDVFQVSFFYPGQLSNVQFAGFQVPGKAVYLQGYLLSLQQPNQTSSTTFSVSLLNGANQPMAGAAVAPDPTLLTITGLQLYSQLKLSPFVGLPSGSFWQASIIVPPTSVGLVGSGLTLTYYFSYANGPVINPQSVFSLAGVGIGFSTIAGSFDISSTP